MIDILYTLIEWTEANFFWIWGGWLLIISGIFGGMEAAKGTPKLACDDIVAMVMVGSLVSITLTAFGPIIIALVPIASLCAGIGYLGYFIKKNVKIEREE